jgi:hypothetical protein
VEICGPKFIAFGIPGESDLVFFKLGEFNELKPIFIVKGKGLEKETKQNKIILRLGLDLEVVLPATVLLSVRVLLDLLQEDIQLLVHDSLIYI